MTSKPPKDRIAVMTAAIGVVLMCFTILTHVNPVEGSVVRPRWLLSAWAAPLHMTLLVSSLPVMAASGYLQALLSHLHLIPTGRFSLVVFYGTMLILQGLMYFGIGKALSLGWRKWRCGRVTRCANQVPAPGREPNHRPAR